ncbi:MAG: hypothetical protein AAF215_05330 [Cyanobacteria bacterium P01_A01_bin.123]
MATKTQPTDAPKVQVQTTGLLGETRVQQIALDTNRLRVKTESLQRFSNFIAIPSRGILLDAVQWVLGVAVLIRLAIALGFLTQSYAALGIRMGAAGVDVWIPTGVCVHASARHAGGLLVSVLPNQRGGLLSNSVFLVQRMVAAMSLQQLHPSEFQNHLHQRFRMGALVWLATGLAVALALATFLNDEYGKGRRHWISTGLIGAGFMVALLGRLAHENAVDTARILLDHADISAASRQQRLYEQMKPDALVATVTQVADIDPDEYLNRAASSWRTHLGVLSPTDTGKSSMLTYLLSKLASQKETVLIAFEPKGAAWPGVPTQNVIRLPFRPTVESAQRMVGILGRVLELAQTRVDTGGTGPQVIVVVEEWLAQYTTLKSVSVLKPLAEEFKSLITVFAAVGRGAGCQLVLVSQSPNVDDLGISGGVRRNFRYLILGSQLGGFEAIDAAVDNGSIVNRRYKDRIDAEYKIALGKLQGDRHPLMMSNLIGDPVIFPSPYLSQSELDGLKIESLPAPPKLLGTGDAGESMSDVSDASLKTTKPNGASLAEIEAEILDVLASADAPLLASEIRQKRSTLKAQSLDLIKLVLNGMTSSGRIRDDGDKDTPRYSLGDVS